MPFGQHFPRSFTAPSVRLHAPASSGVYGISNAGEWIYIGETDNIREALMGHLQQINTAILNRVPTGFVFEVCGRETRNDRQNRLIFEYKPTCNGRQSKQRYWD